MQKKQPYFIWLFEEFELTRHFYGNSGYGFVQQLCFSACAKF